MAATLSVTRLVRTFIVFVVSVRRQFLAQAPLFHVVFDSSARGILLFHGFNEPV
jgi:hypothetical protein